MLNKIYSKILLLIYDLDILWIQFYLLIIFKILITHIYILKKYI